MHSREESTTPLPKDDARGARYGSGPKVRPIQQVYRWCDWGTEGFLWFMIVFSPWAFGTTQEWAITVMNSAGYVLGLLWFLKVGLRRLGMADPRRHRSPVPFAITGVLMGIAVFTLLYCLVSALNYRAAFSEETRMLTYRDALTWLPQSYDAGATWGFLRQWLALALVFWAARDFLLTASTDEPGGFRMPARVRRMLWVLVLNGGLLAMEGLVQRTVGTSQLLWIIEPSINKSPEAQFGPYAYRSNAAQYLLLVWPVGLGFWNVLRRERRQDGPALHNYLLPCILIAAIVPLFSLSRAGTLIGATELLAAGMLFVGRGRQQADRTSVLLGGLLLAAVFLGGMVEWRQLTARFSNDSFDSNRIEIWRNAWKIVKDFPVWGAGPGTFDSIYYMYRESPEEAWAAHAHNDWLEVLATFGTLGAAPVFVGLLLILVAGWVGRREGGTINLLLLLAMGGCLAYAAVDFPFKVYSVAFLYVLIAVMAMVAIKMGRRDELLKDGR